MKFKGVLILLICFLTIAAGSFYWGNNSITVSRYSVSPSGLPESFDGYRIVHVSDLHNKDFGEKLINRISALKPDMIAVTGDIIDSYSTKTEVAVEFIRQAADIAPVYYTTGNHENRLPEEYALLRAEMERAGVIVLDGKTVEIEKSGERISVSGIDDLTFFGSSVLGENKIMFDKSLSSVAQQAGDNVKILLSHRPELFDVYGKNGFDLVLSGHAHGGQIRLPFIGGLFSPGQGFLPEYTEGIHKSGETSMVVSRGLGNSFFPFRIGNRPEIVVCELEK